MDRQKIRVDNLYYTSLPRWVGTQYVPVEACNIKGFMAVWNYEKDLVWLRNYLEFPYEYLSREEARRHNWWCM